MTQHIYITEESLPWLIDANPQERKKLVGRLSTDSRILLLSLIANQYKSCLIPKELSPLLRESPRAGKFHNLFLEVTHGIQSKVLYDMSKKQGDPDKQSLYMAALTQMVNDGDPEAFRYLCEVATTSDQREDLRYTAITGLRMLPDRKYTGIKHTAERAMHHILRDHQSSPEMRNSARNLLDHWHAGHRP